MKPALLLCLAFLPFFSGCEALDRAANPEKYMTPEELAEHKAKLAAKEKAKQEQAAQAEQARQRSEEAMVKEGVGHAETKDASIAGSYAYDFNREEMTSVLFAKKKKKGQHHKAERMSLFANGSYARVLDADFYKGEDWEMDKNLSGGLASTGQWKTEGNKLMVRLAAGSSHGAWQCIGTYEVKGGNLVVVDAERIKAEAGQLKEDQAEEALQVVADYTWVWNRK